MAEAIVQKLNIPELLRMKAAGEALSMATAHDYVTTRLIDAAGIDMVLVSDWSIATTLLGYSTALQVKWHEVMFYLQAVCRLVQHAVVIGAMPFGSYQGAVEATVQHAGLMMKAGVDAVKLEGGGPTIERVRALYAAGIPCVGHLGATPQSVKMRGGLRPYGQTCDEAAQLLSDVQALEAAGAWAVILEGVPNRVAARIGERTRLILIGAGGTAPCDGQMLTTHDILGLPEPVAPLSSRHYADFTARMLTAVNAWCAEVRDLQFPTDKQTFGIKDGEFAQFLKHASQEGT